MFRDIHSRMKSVADRRAQKEQIVEDLRSGKYDGIISGARFWAEDRPARKEQDPTPEPSAPIGLSPLPGGGFHRRAEFVIPQQTGSLDFALLRRLHRGLPNEGALPLPRIAFLDTETTGLNGGTGTLAFLVAVGYWEEGTSDRFVVEQFLVTDFPQEANQLRAFRELLSRFDAVCTYNGRSFDVPLLRSRFILHRLPPAPLRLPHLDLLHPTRRFWKESLGSVSLKQVELRLLGIDRGPDISGAEIPARFFRVCHGEPMDLLEPVLRHNAQDIASLALLVQKLAPIAADPFTCGQFTDPLEWAAVARWLESQRDFGAAAEAQRRAVAGSSEGVRIGRELKLGQLLRRAGDSAAAQLCWESIQRRGLTLGTAPAWVELIKFRDRVSKDYTGAMSLLRQARKQVEIRRQLAQLQRSGEGERWLALDRELAHREVRLARRLARSNEPPQGERTA
jgi:hypothetical protein